MGQWPPAWPRNMPKSDGGADECRDSLVGQWQPAWPFNMTKWWIRCGKMQAPKAGTVAACMASRHVIKKRCRCHRMQGSEVGRMAASMPSDHAQEYCGAEGCRDLRVKQRQPAGPPEITEGWSGCRRQQAPEGGAASAAAICAGAEALLTNEPQAAMLSAASGQQLPISRHSQGVLRAQGHLSDAIVSQLGGDLRRLRPLATCTPSCKTMGKGGTSMSHASRWHGVL